MNRREFLGAVPVVAVLRGISAPHPNQQTEPLSQQSAADHIVRIATGLLETAPNRFIATTLYNGQFPGPVLRLRQGVPVTVDVYNDTDTPEQIHWHGLPLPVDVDGSAEEGTPFIPPHGFRRVTFTPELAGMRLYHTHTFAGIDLRAASYGGQFGVVYVEPRQDAGAYDREAFLVLKEFSPALTRMPDQDADFLEPADRNPELRRMAESAHEAALARGVRHGFEITYSDFTVNGKTLGFGDPIRVRAGERLLLHFANASATAIRGIALPGHTFHVVALDGNLVPTPHDVDVVWVGPGERVSAIVRMSHPGKWILGDVGEDRWQGLGIVVEYANSSGAAQWTSPSSGSWDYTRFGGSATPTRPDATIDLLFSEEEAAADGFNRWLINGVPFSMTHMEPRFRLQRGRRYRIRLRNASDDVHPLHLHRHTFQLTKVAGRPTSGVQKDVVMVGPYQELEIDFTADARGLSLFHCHMQLHMDFGFMALFDCA